MVRHIHIHLHKTKDADAPLVLFEGKPEDWERAIKAMFPTVHFAVAYGGANGSGKEAWVGNEMVGSIRKLPSGLYKGGYRKELRGND